MTAENSDDEFQRAWFLRQVTAVRYPKFIIVFTKEKHSTLS